MSSDKDKRPASPVCQKLEENVAQISEALLTKVTSGDLGVQLYVLDRMNANAESLSYIVDRAKTVLGSVSKDRVARENTVTNDVVQRLSKAVSTVDEFLRLAMAPSLDTNAINEKRSDARHATYKDMRFLDETRSQLRQISYSPNSGAEHARDVMLKHLHHVNPVQQFLGKDQTHPEAHILNIFTARDLLESSATITAPIFVHGTLGFKWSDYSNTKSPITQLLEWLPDPNEELPYLCQRCPKDSEMTDTATVCDLIKTFGQATTPRYPRNFVDIQSPLAYDTLPEFLRGPNCNLLTDIKRICLQADIPAAHLSSGDRHLQPDLMDSHWRSYERLVMLSEPGSLTLPHWDDFGYATWLTCREGHIGFAWLSHPCETLLTEWRENEDTQHKKGRWLFKVLRQGDTVYIGPGTVHYVFRRPEGKATMAAAGSVLRRTDMSAWLTILLDQIKDAIRTRQTPNYSEVVPHLLKAVMHLLDVTQMPHSSEIPQADSARVGGVDRVNTSARLVYEIDDQLKILKTKEKERAEYADADVEPGGTQHAHSEDEEDDDEQADIDGHDDIDDSHNIDYQSGRDGDDGDLGAGHPPHGGSVGSQQKPRDGGGRSRSRQSSKKVTKDRSFGPQFDKRNTQAQGRSNPQGTAAYDGSDEDNIIVAPRRHTVAGLEGQGTPAEADDKGEEAADWKEDPSAMPTMTSNRPTRKKKQAEAPGMVSWMDVPQRQVPLAKRKPSRKLRNGSVD